MSIDSCLKFCVANNFLFAGLQLSNQCHCQNTYPTLVPLFDCNLKCAGNSEEICGGFQRQSFYTAQTTSIACPLNAMNLGIAKMFCNVGVIDVIHALYGRLDNETCSGDFNTTMTCNSTVDHTEITRSYCNGKKVCLYQGTENEMGDPCPGELKYTEIKYSCLHSNKSLSFCSKLCFQLNRIWIISYYAHQECHLACKIILLSIGVI